MHNEMAGMVSAARVPITVVVLTFNEALNIRPCLESVAGWTAETFVVDSGSQDGTRELAEACGARVWEHAFETHARQWTWALETLPLTTAWVLALDADQRVTPELRASIETHFLSGRDTGVDGLYLNRRQIFRGRWIRYGGYYPKYLLKLFRRDAVSVDAVDLVDHHFRVAGRVAILRGDLIEDNQNEARIAVWIEKHNRYARLQAQQEVEHALPRTSFRAFGNTPDARTQWWKSRWAGLPLLVRPCLYFFYRYVIRLGFLDGREGFVFHVLQAFWYRLLVDINIAELRSARTGRPRERHGQ